MPCTRPYATDVQGRKLRVEYKKVLQASEKERIEREKALRRMRSMQLKKEQITPGYEDYGNVLSSAAFSPQRSFFSSSYQQQQSQYSPPHISNMPSPFSLASAPAAPQSFPPAPSSDKGSSNELDLNDPSTLEIYSRILLFKDDRMRDELVFSRMLSPKQRRVVHLIAQKLGVYHYSVGEGDERYAVVTRINPQRVSTGSTGPYSLSSTLCLSDSHGIYHINHSRIVAHEKSMPDLKTLHSQAPRLTTRASNGNIREGYATIASPSRHTSGLGSLFANGGAFGNSGVPPVPNLPTGLYAWLLPPKPQIFVGEVQPERELGSQVKFHYLGESQKSDIADVAERALEKDESTSESLTKSTRKKKSFYVGMPPSTLYDDLTVPASLDVGNAFLPINVDGDSQDLPAVLQKHLSLIMLQLQFLARLATL
ncbi:hypothetical protein EV361DRAFT_955272 [Lentinula raphanica]|nr:hypothetical protein EV361DRAFT_955272 [Lentinula raphanica]